MFYLILNNLQHISNAHNDGIWNYAREEEECEMEYSTTVPKYQKWVK